MAARLFAENYLLKIGYRTGRFAASSMQLFRQRPSQGFKGQWRRKIDNWGGGGGAIFIYSCSALLTSFEIDCF